MRIERLPIFFSRRLKMPGHVKTKDDRQYWHVKNGGSVLLVAHIDTVCKPEWRGIKGGTIYAAGLDDRLGVWLAFELLHARSDVDVLITDEEERGTSTAELVLAEDLAGYNCIIGLDRAGVDFVDYGLSCNDLIDVFRDYGPFGQGSFSDICSLFDPPCSCINVGVGYELAHSPQSYAKLCSVQFAFNRMMDFLDNWSDTFFPPPDITYCGVDDFYGSIEMHKVCVYCGVDLWEDMDTEENIAEGICADCWENMGLSVTA